MEQISNPLPPRKRGLIYSLGIIYGAAVGVAAPALLAMGMPATSPTDAGQASQRCAEEGESTA